LSDNEYAEITYEEALADLEKIVQKMEDGELPLEDLIAAFQQGIKLTRLCRQKLTETEQKIEYLLKEERQDVIDYIDPSKEPGETT